MLSQGKPARIEGELTLLGVTRSIRMQIISQGVEAKGYAEYLKKQAEKK